MNSKRPVRGIKLLKPLFSFLGVFLIAPWYDFDKDDFHNLNISRAYGLLLVVLKIFWLSCLTTNDATRRNFQEFLFSVKFLFVFSVSIFVARTVLTVCKATFWSVDDWKTLITNFRKIDGIMYKQTAEGTMYRNFYLSLAIKHGLFVVYVTYQGYAWTTFLELSLSETVMMSPILDYYCEFLLIVLVSALVQCVRRRHEDLNEKLVEVFESSKLEEEAKNLLEMYRLLGENVDICSRIFGYLLILTLFSWAVEMILCLNYIFLIVVYVNHSQHKKLLICNIFTMAFVTYNFLTIISSIDSAVRESRKFIDLCHKLQEGCGLGSREDDILERMVNCSKHSRREFSANGFFNINKSIIFGLIGNVATYYIITIQFNESQYQKSGKNETVL